MNAEHKLAQIALRSWPFPRGAGRLIDKFFSATRFSDKTVKVRTTDGFDITVMPNDLIGRHIYLTGEFDRTVVEVLCNFALPGDVLLDVGANIGYVSSCFLQNVPNSRAIAIEPQPVVGGILMQNLLQFGKRQTVFNVALSDNDGEAHFQVGQTNTGTSAIVDTQTHRSIKVPTRSPDSLLAELGEAVNLIKIDVEGHEEIVLSSCRSWLSQTKPRAIVFEEHGVKCAPGGSIATILGDLGYAIYGIKKTLTAIKLNPVLSELDCNCVDFIAIRPGAVTSIARRAYGL